MENPDLSGGVERGELGEEQMDAIASASEKSGGDAARDERLVADIVNARPDDAGRIAGRWLERRDDANGTQSRYDRQRARRGVRRGYDPAAACDSVTAQGDCESAGEMYRAVEARADELYRADGGRDVPADQHPRTHRQRMYDALHQLVTGNASKEVSGSAGSTGGGVRSMVHVSITVDDDDADLVRAHVVGGDGYLPESVLERYGCASMVAGTVFSRRGEVLWFGRGRRNATPSQFAALVARDGGCVKCGAGPSRCQAHHLTPFNAPKRGETNVVDMALLCTDHHAWLHEEQLTLYWQLGPPDPATGERKRVWLARQATADEIAPSGRHRSRRQPKPDAGSPGSSARPNPSRVPERPGATR